MGFGNGISIGWPNAMAQNSSSLRSGYFQIVTACYSTVKGPAYTHYLQNVDYKSGDYVFSPSLNAIVLLGDFFILRQAGTHYSVEGPIYNSCQILPQEEEVPLQEVP